MHYCQLIALVQMFEHVRGARRRGEITPSVSATVALTEKIGTDICNAVLDAALFHHRCVEELISSLIALPFAAVDITRAICPRCCIYYAILTRRNFRR